MAGFPLAAIGAGLGQWAQFQQQQQAARERQQMLALTLQRYQQEQQDRQNQQQAAQGEWAMLSGGGPGGGQIAPVDPGGSFPGAQRMPAMPQPQRPPAPPGAGGYGVGQAGPPTPAWARGGQQPPPLPINLDAMDKTPNSFTPMNTPPAMAGGNPGVAGTGEPRTQVADASGGQSAAPQPNQQLAQTIPPEVNGRMSATALAKKIDQVMPGAPPEAKLKVLKDELARLAPIEQERIRLMMQQNSQIFSEGMADRRADRADARQDARTAAQSARDEAKEKARWGDPIKMGEQYVQVNKGTGEVRPVQGLAGDVSRIGSGNQAAAKPETVDFVANGIAKYDMAPLSGWAMRSPFGQQVMAKVFQLNPEYDQTKYNAKARGSVSFTSGRQGDAIRSFSVAIDHLATMEDAATALANNDVRALNFVQNRVAQEFGYEGPIDFTFTKSIVGAEVSKAVIGGVGALKDREELRDAFNAANSPEQLAGVARQAKKLMAGQLGGYRRQAGAAGMSEADFERALSPRAKLELEGLAGGAPSTGSPATPATPAAKGAYAVPDDVLKAIDAGTLTPEAGKKLLIEQFGYTPQASP